jgi:hypothetical protein
MYLNSCLCRTHRNCTRRLRTETNASRRVTVKYTRASQSEYKSVVSDVCPSRVSQNLVVSDVCPSRASQNLVVSDVCPSRASQNLVVSDVCPSRASQNLVVSDVCPSRASLLNLSTYITESRSRSRSRSRNIYFTAQAATQIQIL